MYTLEQIQNKIDNKYGKNKMKVIEYTKMKEPLKVKCLDCNKTLDFNKAEGVLYKDNPICDCNKQRKDTLEVKNKIKYILKNTDKEVIIPFSNITTDMQFKCIKCNNTFNRKPRIFLKSQKCPYCESRSKLKTEDIFISDLRKKYGNEYQLIGKYKGANAKTLIKHTYCGMIWEITPHNLLCGKGCPKCNRFSSKGEKKISKFLEDNKINYIPEFSFKNTNISNLRFDFYLPKTKELIEFQGEQHYKSVKWFGGQENYEKQLMRDNLKKQFCIDNKYILIEISFDKINEIETILAQRLLAEMPLDSSESK